MPIVATSQLAPGVALEEPVFDRDGSVLLKAGAVLTPALIARLHLWQIATVSVAAPRNAAPAAAGSTEEAALAPAEVWARLFAPYENDVETARIHEAFRLWHERQPPPEVEST